MAQRSGITQQPLGLAPALILKRCHRLVELSLSRLSAIESPPGIKPRQSCLDLFHRLVRLDRLIEERFSFAPGPPRCPRHPSCIPPAPLGLGHLGIGLTRRLELTLCSLLYPPQGPLPTPGYPVRSPSKWARDERRFRRDTSRGLAPDRPGRGPPGYGPLVPRLAAPSAPLWLDWARLPRATQWLTPSRPASGSTPSHCLRPPLHVAWLR